MPSQREYLFFLKLCFMGILMILGSMVYLFNVSEINTILSIYLREGLVVFIVTSMFLWGCLVLCFGSFRLIFSFRSGRALERITVGTYDVVSCSQYAGKAILILRQQKLYSKFDPFKLYSLPTRLVFGSDPPRNIGSSDCYQLIVDYEQGQIFCRLEEKDYISAVNEFGLDYRHLGSSVTDSSDYYIDSDPLDLDEELDEEAESTDKESTEADPTVFKP